MEQVVHRISDEALIEELKNRFQENKKALLEIETLMSELKNVNKKLESSEQMKGQFLSNIRNEIINPFAAILGFSKKLMEGYNTDPNQTRSIARLIYTEAFSLDFQLQNIFMAAELESGDAVPEPSYVDVAQIVESVTAAFEEGREPDKRIIVSVDPQLKQTHFITDAPKLGIVLSNLLSNAIRFSAKESAVYLRMMLDDGFLKIEVEDEGIGISPEFHKIVFDRFMQLDSSRTKQYAGHGLGLSITKGLTELLGGISN